MAILVKDADKLTMGQNVMIVAPHSLESIIRQPPDRWMTNAQMTHHQSLLLTEQVNSPPPRLSSILLPCYLRLMKPLYTNVRKCWQKKPEFSQTSQTNHGEGQCLGTLTEAASW